jgi:phosphatidylethanolamine/phosphatidyl-N-methylethanolamine N-methyltransferase
VNRQTSKFYDNFSFFYPLVDVFLRSQKRVLFDEINKLPAGKVLEIGVGNGAQLKHYTTHKVTAIDSSIKMLDIARKKKISNVEFIPMNGEDLLFEKDSFDYVVMSHVIAVVDEPEKMLRESFRVLKPGGRIIILNHFTPGNWLRYIDKSFSFLSRRFHFRSHFRMEDLKTLSSFDLLKRVDLGWFSYFKLLIYQKK